MTFSEMKSACDDFRALLSSSTGHDCIHEVTVCEPYGDEDELHFVRLVLWCYAFWFEACHPAGNHIASLLKVASPQDYKKVEEPFRIVRHLRTATAHNLAPASKENDRTSQQATIWLKLNCGDPRDWQRCCHTLSADVKNAVERLHQVWDILIQNSDDAQAGVDRLLQALKRDWPAHGFDRMVERAADSLRISGLDVVAYRSKRLQDWRILAGYFEDRNFAEEALQRAIQQELSDLFGSQPQSVEAASDAEKRSLESNRRTS
jgi:hypothetical protein